MTITHVGRTFAVLSGALAVAVAAAVMAAPAAAQTAEPAAARRGDLHEGHRADPAAELPEVPPARLAGPDVADRLRRGAAVGARHQVPHRPPRPDGRDAALVHREGRRHPGLQGRPVPDRGGDPQDRRLGGQRRAAGQPGGHAAAGGVHRRRRVGDRPARPHRPHAERRGEGGRAGLVGRAGGHADQPAGGSLRRGGRVQGDHRVARRRGPQHRRRELRVPPRRARRGRSGLRPRGRAGAGGPQQLAGARGRAQRRLLRAGGRQADRRPTRRSPSARSTCTRTAPTPGRAWTSASSSTRRATSRPCGRS